MVCGESSRHAPSAVASLQEMRCDYELFLFGTPPFQKMFSRELVTALGACLLHLLKLPRGQSIALLIGSQLSGFL
jgi:hypothetical protein